MVLYIKQIIIFFIFGFFLTACSEEEPASKEVADKETTSIEQMPEQVSATEQDPLPTATSRVELSNNVIYQEAIYKNWPYTEIAVATTTEEVIDDEKSTVEPKDEVVAAETTTHMVNAQARIFKPDTIYINPGDVVQWVNMTSHNTVSVEGLIPEGAKHWRSQLGENLKIKLDIEGIYAYVCEPHIGFGMVGVIVVGKPTNLDEVVQFAKDNLQGPYRRLIGKLIKVKIP